MVNIDQKVIPWGGPSMITNYTKVSHRLIRKWDADVPHACRVSGEAMTAQVTLTASTQKDARRFSLDAVLGPLLVMGSRARMNTIVHVYIGCDAFRKLPTATYIPLLHPRSPPPADPANQPRTHTSIHPSNA